MPDGPLDYPRIQEKERHVRATEARMPAFIFLFIAFLRTSLQAPMKRNESLGVLLFPFDDQSIWAWALISLQAVSDNAHKLTDRSVQRKGTQSTVSWFPLFLLLFDWAFISPFFSSEGPKQEEKERIQGPIVFSFPFTRAIRADARQP